MGDIVLTQERSLAELKALTDEIESQISSKVNSAASIKVDTRKKKRQTQKHKKRKRDEDGEEEKTDKEEELNVSDGEKVFLKSRTSKTHYLEIIKEMEYIKGMPVTC